MHVSNPEHWDQTSAPANDTAPEPLQADPESTQEAYSQQSGTAVDALEQGDDSAGAPPAQEEAIARRSAKYLHSVHDKRRRCQAGKAFYRCANGFTGCCSIDPCNPGETCPDEQNPRVKTKTATTTVFVSRTSSNVYGSTATSRVSKVTGEPTRTDQHESTIYSSTDSMQTSLLLVPGTSSTVPGATSITDVPVPSTPSCPQGNGTTYTDNSKIQYTIRCDSNNTNNSYKIISVGTGGYAECFSACSNSKSCVGFTYAGSSTGSGNCYLKSKMPAGSYQNKGNNEYISCDKTDPSAVAPSITGTSSASGQSKGTKIGIIVGAVLGGILLIILILLIIAYLAKRHRKKVERRRATITHVIQGPIETQQLNTGGHQRQGSSSHDVFAPFGGFYEGWHRASSRVQRKYEVPLVDMGRSSTPPGIRAEGGLTLPAITYQRPKKSTTVDISTLDASVVGWASPQTSGSRSPRFHEHLDDAEEGSTIPLEAGSPYSNDSPTLGQNFRTILRSPLADQVRRQQHLIQQKEQGQRDAYTTPPDRRTPSPISPVSGNEPVDGYFAVSPLFSS